MQTFEVLASNVDVSRFFRLADGEERGRTRFLDPVGQVDAQRGCIRLKEQVDCSRQRRGRNDLVR